MENEPCEPPVSVESPRKAPWAWWLAWIPALGITIVAVVASFIVAVVVLLAYVIATQGAGVLNNPETFQTAVNQMADSTAGFFIMIAPQQLALVSFAIILGLVSRQGITQRLALAPGTWSPLWWPILALSAPAVGLGVETATEWLQWQPSNHLVGLQEIIAQQAQKNFLAVAFALAVLPGTCEELLFRGFLQNRLLRVWPAWTAIGLSSLIFAAAHFDPQHIILVIPLGIWLGVIAWKTGSILPAIAGHFCNNLFATVQVTQWASTDSGQTFMTVSCSLFVLCLVVSLVAVCCLKTAPHPTLPWLATPTQNTGAQKVAIDAAVIDE